MFVDQGGLAAPPPGHTIQTPVRYPSSVTRFFRSQKRGMGLCQDENSMGYWAEPDEEKLAELILYVAGRLQDDAPGGATKLNKLLFFSECSHIRAYGDPITGSHYQKLPEGPAPLHLIPIRDGLCSAGHAEMREDSYFGYRLDRLVPLRPADEGRFRPEELKTVDQVVDAFWGKTAREVSDLSHEEMGWRIVEENEIIPLSTAFLAKKVLSPTERVRVRGAELAKNLGR